MWSICKQPFTQWGDDMELLIAVFIVGMIGMFMTLGAYDTKEREKKNEIDTK